MNGQYRRPGGYVAKLARYLLLLRHENFLTITPVITLFGTKPCYQIYLTLISWLVNTEIFLNARLRKFLGKPPSPEFVFDNLPVTFFNNYRLTGAPRWRLQTPNPSRLISCCWANECVTIIGHFPIIPEGLSTVASNTKKLHERTHGG